MKLITPVVIAAAVVHWIAGAAWYGVFAGVFASYIGDEQLRELEQRSEPVAFGLAFVSSLAVACVLAWLLDATHARRMNEVARCVLIAWIGLVVTTQAQTVLFEGRHIGLFALAVGYQLLGMACVAAIIAWRLNAAEKGHSHFARSEQAR